jgi:tubulin-specific chaperone A
VGGIWLTIQQVEEGKKGSESNVEHINAAKEAIANARVAEREIA